VSEKNEIVILSRDEVPKSEVDDGEDPTAPKVGRWYWVTGEEWSSKKGKDVTRRWLGCCVRVGSNYLKIEYVGDSSERIHLNEFYERCEYVPDPDGIIAENVLEYQGQVKSLMGDVKELTARLSIGISPSLSGASSETAALAVRSNERMDGYEKALVKAKDETLPELFKKIEKANKRLAMWMSAKVIPLKAQAKSLKSSIGKIEDRIFSVQLYAGLVEKIHHIREGEPAPLTEKVHLFQRRGYMDEECLLCYEAGGMEFKNIGEFHQWFARPENMNRLLPYPKCIMAFRVRRNEKNREIVNLRDFIRVIDEHETDKFTYLYIRNGEQLFCLATEIEFEAKLFPDIDRTRVDGNLYVDNTWSEPKIISEGEYKELVAEDARRDAEMESADPKDRWRFSHSRESQRYKPFTPDNLHYDDTKAHLDAAMAKHNRLVLLLQGLLDRSPVLHPHPPWQLWTADGFTAALTLLYDDDRALVAGEKPDFEAYRARLNASLKTGSITIGQDEAWTFAEAEKESRRLDADYRTRSDYRPTRHRPYGNPGPGLIAKVAKYGPRTKTCTYEWTRKRLIRTWKHDFGEPIPTSFTCKADVVLNVDAYKAGDFKQFFNDPRTRAEYLKWAPLLLTAEDYLAGKRKLGKPPKGAVLFDEDDE
jgi:hypothetical protein